MGGAYGGAGAAGFAGGFMQGYNFVDTANSNRQAREIKAKEASQLAEARKLQIESTGYKVAGEKEIYDQMQTLKGQLAQQAGIGANTGFANIQSATPEELGDTIRANMTQYQEAYKAMGLKDHKSAGPVETDRDKKKLLDHALKQGLNLDGWTDAEVSELLDKMSISGQFLMADNKLTDVGGLTAVMGGADTMSPAQKALIQKKTKSIQDMYSKISDRAAAREAFKEAQEKVLQKRITEHANTLAGYSSAAGGGTSATPKSMVQDKIYNQYRNGEITLQDMNKQLLASEGSQSLLKTDVDDSPNPLVAINKLKAAATAKYGTNLPDEVQSEIDYAEDVYAKNFYGTVGAQSKASIRAHQKGMTPAQKEDDNTYRGVSNQKGLIKNWDAANKAYDGAVAANQTRNKMYTIIENNDLDWNAVSTASNEANAYMSFMWDPTTSEKQKAKAYAALKTNVGLEVAEFIHSMSGAAASNEERSFLTDIVFGGMWKSPEALEGTMNEYVNKRAEKANTLYDEYGSQVKPNKSKERQDRMASWTARELNVQPSSSKTDVIQEVKDAGSEIVDDVSKRYKAIFGDTEVEPIDVRTHFTDEEQQNLLQMPEGKSFTDTKDGKQYIIIKGTVYPYTKKDQ